MTTGDAFLSGMLRIRQPERGFRAGLDSVMLAAAVPATGAQSVFELGSGAGAAALCLAVRVPAARVTGLEIQSDLVSLAMANAQDNGLGGRVTVLPGDAALPPSALPRDHFDHAMMNPPFFVEGREDASPDRARSTASIGDGELLARWAKPARTHLHAKGTLTANIPAARLAAMLDALEPGFGGIVIVPLWPRAGEAAKRIIVHARKGSRAPLSLRPGLVLHGAGAKFTPEAEAVLRHGAALSF